MKKAIENLIPSAVQAVQQLKTGNYIPSEYNGYIASLGASIVQMGLLPTIAVFSDRDSGSLKNKNKLLKVILDVLRDDINVRPQLKNTLFETVLALHNQPDKLLQLRNAITNASIAIKLSMRTYEMKKGKGGNDE